MKRTRGLSNYPNLDCPSDLSFIDAKVDIVIESFSILRARKVRERERARERNKKKTTGTSNPTFDYSSDSSFEDNYLSDEQERRLRSACNRFMVTACEQGHMPWDADPVRTANFLKEVNEKFGWQIPIDMDDIKKKLKIADDEIKAMSELYQKQRKKNPRTEEKYSCKKKSVKRRKCSTSSTTSSQNSDGAAVGGGGEVVAALFIKRKLTATDIDDHQHKLSMPTSEVQDSSFLTKEEKEKLENSDLVGAKVIVPLHGGSREYNTYLKLRVGGRTSKSYVIGKPWNQIKKENGFAVGTKLKVRGYRGQKGELCLRLDRVG